MPVVLVGIALFAAIDAHQPRMFGVAAGDRVIFQLAEAAREGDVFGAADVLIAQEQHPMREQQRLDFGEQASIVRGVAQADSRHFGTDRTGQFFDFHPASSWEGRAAQPPVDRAQSLATDLINVDWNRWAMVALPRPAWRIARGVALKAIRIVPGEHGGRPVVRSAIAGNLR